MKKVLTVIIWIVILGAILFGVYTVLPEYPHNVIKGHVQMLTDAEAKNYITKVQNLFNDDVDATYQMILEKNTSLIGWVHELPEENAEGVRKVIFYGNGASINIHEIQGYDDMLYTSCAVKIEFRIGDNNSVDIVPYIDGELIQVPDNKKTNDALKELIFDQLYNGSDTNRN